MSKPTKAANLARAIWRLKGACENCGKTKDQGKLDGAHIFGKGSHIRICSDIRNGFCLCTVCHRRFHDNPIAFTNFINSTWAKAYIPVLEKLARPSAGAKIDWNGRISFLTNVKKRMEDGELTIEQARNQENKEI